MNGFLQVVKSL